MCQQALPGRLTVTAGGLNQLVTPTAISLLKKQSAVIQKIRGAYDEVHATPSLTIGKYIIALFLQVKIKFPQIGYRIIQIHQKVDSLFYRLKLHRFPAAGGDVFIPVDGAGNRTGYRDHVHGVIPKQL
jgi:hypothetical protein